MGIILFRTLIVFTILLICMRLMGKRQLGELEVSELVISILIANFAAHPLQDIDIPLMNGLLPIVILLCCELIISGLIMKSSKVRVIMCGKPSILIADGKINQAEMKQNRFTLDELTVELRGQGITDLSIVKFAILETDGKLNVILFPAEMPVTAGQLNIASADPGYAKIVINDGRVMSNNLRMCGKDERWLEKELKQRKVKSPKDVYFMTVNGMDQIYFAKKEAAK